MPRPPKCRRVCAHPLYASFAPESGSGRTLSLTLDEYEVIRLIDLEGMTQEECAAQMEVARTTVQAIYASARRTLARCIVEGHGFRIEGGPVRVREHRGGPCGRGCRRLPFEGQNNAAIHQIAQSAEGEKDMKIAVTYDKGEIFQHFGKTEQFKVYEIKDGKVQSSAILDTNGKGHGALSGFLKENGVSALICGGIGEGAKTALTEEGITLYGGVSGQADQAVEDFLSDKLSYSTDTTCNHHGEDHHHHGEGHVCGGH